jgi:2-phospho-L-lactate guanylyltransferase
MPTTPSHDLTLDRGFALRPTATALIPLRTGGKSRLSTALDATRRRSLVLAMLDDVLAALRAAGVTDVRVLAGDADAADAAVARDLPAILDPLGPVAGAPTDPAGGTTGDARLCRAVDAGLAHLPSSAVRLVVAADLPLLRGEDVTAVLSRDADVVVAPTRGGGTGVLLLAGGVLLPTRYGPASATAHAGLARAQGLRVDVLDLPGAQHDVDGAADLAELRTAGQHPLGAATADFLAEQRG